MKATAQESAAIVRQQIVERERRAVETDWTAVKRQWIREIFYSAKRRRLAKVDKP
tara:strand:- start:584 stop:748 length:165 start_codon:yes stop_codon:yes gene_type:complete